MSQEFHLFVLQKLSPQSNTFVGELVPTVDVSLTGTLGLLKEAVRGHVKSLQKFKSWGEDVDRINFVVHKVRRRSFQQLSSKPLTLISSTSPPSRLPNALGNPFPRMLPLRHRTHKDCRRRPTKPRGFTIRLATL